MNKCSYHPQEKQDIVCLYINCAQSNFVCQKCLVKHQAHLQKCVKLEQIANQFRTRVIENFKVQTQIIVDNQLSQFEHELIEFQSDLNECKTIFDQKELKNIFQEIENFGEQICSYFEKNIELLKGRFIQFKLKEKIEMTQIKKNLLQQTSEGLLHKISQTQQNNLQDFWQEYQRIQESKGQFIDKSIQEKEFYVYETPQRIQNILNKPINFFCNERGENVFASDGVEVKLDDIQARSTGKDIVFQLGILLSSFCPQKLKEIFLMTEVNYSGFYGIKRTNMNNKQSTIMCFDDFVPLFSNEVIVGKNNSIWITILEKAFAKINGSYSFFDSRPLYLLSMVFPIPMIKIWTNEENIDIKILEELKNKSLILIEPRSLQSTNFMHSNYVQITGVRYVQNPFFGEQVLLFELKNPVGKHHYQGDWGFQSPYWTEEVKNELKVKNYDDGIFYMDFVSFLVDVDSVESYRLFDEKVAAEFFILNSKQGSYFSLDVQNDCSLVMFIDLQEKEKLDFHVAIAQISKQKSTKQFIEQSLEEVVFNKALSFSQFQSVPFNLSKGSYIMYVKIKSAEYWRQSREAQLMLFGQSPVSFQQSQKYNNFKQSTMKSLITQNGSLFINKSSFNVKRVIQKDLGWIAFEVKNKLQTEIKIAFALNENSKGKLAKPFQQKRNEITIRGQEEVVIIVKNDINAQLQFEAN